MAIDMDMIKVSAGKLRAIGYEAKTRTLRVQLDDGSALEYSSIAKTLWRKWGQTPFISRRMMSICRIR